MNGTACKRLILAALVALLVPHELRAVDFDTQIVPVLTRAGCNTGQCHGSAEGRGGLRLSLFGSRPIADYHALVTELQGRRVNLADPERSLLVLKPTEFLPHGGGTRLDMDDEGAARLLDWIRQGAQPGGGRRLAGYEVEPREAVVERGQRVALRATALFSDGTREDVTRWTVFTANDPTAVELDEDQASLRIEQPGLSVVVARYLDRVVPIRLLVPWPHPPADYSQRANAGHFVDDEILATLQLLQVPLSARADDAAFLRRLRLDLTGRLPSPEEVGTFVADADPDKRTTLVDRLLDSQDFTEYWTYKLAQWLRIGAGPLDPEGTAAFHAWVREQLGHDTSYAEMARTLLTAEGDSHAVGPANFQRVSGDARLQAEYTSEVLLGVRLACANCHDHPSDRWTQDDYHGLAALLAGVERGRFVRYAGPAAITNLRTGEAALPRIPGERNLSAEGDHRQYFAEWLTSRENPYFARAVANRLWHAMMGRGLVEPVDDLSLTNPPTHPRLLEMLAHDFIDHGYRLRHTLRRIATSASYARSAASRPGNESDRWFYSRAAPKPLQAEVLADAIADVTGVADRYGDLPLGTRAVTLADPRLPADSLDILGRCPRDGSCDDPGRSTTRLSAVLHLLNGPLLNQKIASPQGHLRQRIAQGASDRALISEFYLRALARPPSDDEWSYWKSQLAGSANPAERTELLEDFLWSLLSSRAFVMNH